MKITKEQIENINTYDKVGTDCFGVDRLFGFRFNYNMRWFWAMSHTTFHYKQVNMENSTQKDRIAMQQVCLN